MARIVLILAGLVSLLVPVQTIAQQANAPLLYSHQAVQFSSQDYTLDPVTLVMPGTAFFGGFSSFLDNPASAAVVEESFGSFGFSFDAVSEETLYLGNSFDMNRGQAGISNIGFVYRFPTLRGSFVVGAGYSQHSFYNRATSVFGRNETSSMTDFFKIPGSTYEDIAFNTYAIDWWDEEQTFLESIFRIGFPQGEWFGITQQAEIKRGGHSGEYSAFVATEFAKDFMVGLSVGLGSGKQQYDRTFLEIDEFNDYDGDFIDSNDDGTGDTDIDKILLSDDITSNFYSFKARLGALYRVSDNVQLGASWLLPSRLNVSETFDSQIVSTFDNGEGFEDDLGGEYSWAVKSPSQFSLGLAVVDAGPVSVSLAADYIDYSGVEVDFDTEQFEEERIENEFIGNHYQAVWNLRGGLSVAMNDQVTLRAGYGFLPSKFRQIDVDKKLVSAGAGFVVGPDMRLEVGARYTMYDDPSVLYSYEDAFFNPQTEFVQKEVSRLSMLATLRIRLY